MHPNGGAAVDPKSTLDGWINEDLANVPNLIASYQANAPKAVAAAGFIRRFDVGDQGMFSAPGRFPSPSSAASCVRFRATPTSWRTAAARTASTPTTP